MATYGDYLYYSSGYSDVDDGRFCKIKKDGTEFSILNEDSPCFINILYDKIYYIAEKNIYSGSVGQVYSMNLDGSKKERIISEKCSDLIVTSEGIYYVDDSNGGVLCRVGLDGKSKEVLHNENCIDLQYQDGYLYYSLFETNEIKRFPINDVSNVTKLIDYSYN